MSIFRYYSGVDALVYPGPDGKPIAATRKMLKAMLPDWSFSGIEYLPRANAEIEMVPANALKHLPPIPPSRRR
jgi:hypothetical protein